MPTRLPRLLLLLLLFLTGPALAMDQGDRLVPFATNDLDGKQIDLARLMGKQPVILVFWTSWCPNCKREAERVNELHRRYGQRGLQIIGINVGYNDTVDRARRFIGDQEMTFPTIFDQDHRITDQYEVLGVPTIFIADRQGVIRFKNYGVPDLSEETFQALLAGQ